MPNTEVYAAEDGVIKKRATTSSNNWGGYMAIEHNHPVSGKFITVYWHISPASGTAEGDFVPKGMKIATVQDISAYHTTHFHFGVQKSSYSVPTSYAGGLPQTNCGGYPAFPAGFIDPDNTSNVLFQ